MQSAAYKKFNDRVNKMLSKQASVLGNSAMYNGRIYRLGSPSNAARMFSNGGLEALNQTMFNDYQN